MSMDLQQVGAGCFGAIVGWYVYFINRHRTAEVQFSDLVSVVGIIGGGTVVALYKPGTPLFGAYGIGLAVGFFGYLLVLALLVRRSKNFDADWFLDGRRKGPKDEKDYPDKDHQQRPFNEVSEESIEDEADVETVPENAPEQRATRD